MHVHLHPHFLTVPLAHRTFHDLDQGRPENSIEGAKAAIAAGYGMEIDVQLSKDGCAIVFHDDDLDRLTAKRGPIRDRTSAELAGILLKGGDTAPPTLPVFLELVDGQVPLLIEIKDQDGAMGPDVGPLEQAVCAALRGYGGPVALMSFNPHSVLKCAELAPEIPRGLVTEKFTALEWRNVPSGRRAELAVIPDYDHAGACFISHSIRDLASPHVQKVREKGGKILCWTVRSPVQEKKARKLADNITFEGYHALKTGS